MSKVKSIDEATPEELKASLNEEDLEPIRKGEYTIDDYAKEITKQFHDPDYSYSKTWGVYSTLLYMTQQNPRVKGDIRTVWKKVLDEYDGPKQWGEYSLYDSLNSHDLTPLEVYDNILGRPLREQEEYLRSRIPAIAEQREYEANLYASFEKAILKAFPDIREQCEELAKLREELGDPNPEMYKLEYAIAETVNSNKYKPREEAPDIGFVKAILYCYDWSKRASQSIKELEDLEQGPYKPLIDWIKGLAPEDDNVLGYNANLVRVKEALDVIIKEEGLTEASPGDLKTIQKNWKKEVVRLLKAIPEEDEPESLLIERSLEQPQLIALPNPDWRTLGVDKGNRTMPLIKSEPTTLDNFDWHGQAFINFGSKDVTPHNDLKFQVYTPQGERQGLTGIERAISGYIGTLLRANTPQGMADRDRYGRVEITENDFIKKLMGLVEGDNIKAHQEEIYNTLTRMSMSRIEVDIPKSNTYNDKFIKAIEELYVEMNGVKPIKSKDKNIRISVEKNMLIFEVVKVYVKGTAVRKYIFETMPFNEYLSIKFQQSVQVKDSLYRTPVLTPEELTPHARDIAEEYGLYSKDRKTKGKALMLENSLDNLGLKDWVASTIELKRKKYNPIILEYEDLYAQVKGASVPLTDREKRTLKANLKRYLVYLLNNPSSDVTGFTEFKAQKSKKCVAIHVYLKGSKTEILDDNGEN